MKLVYYKSQGGIVKRLSLQLIITLYYSTSPLDGNRKFRFHSAITWYILLVSLIKIIVKGITHGSVGWCVGWLVGWLVGCMVGYLVGSNQSYSPTITSANDDGYTLTSLSVLIPINPAGFVHMASRAENSLNNAVRPLLWAIGLSLALPNTFIRISVECRLCTKVYSIYGFCVVGLLAAILCNCNFIISLPQFL